MNRKILLSLLSVCLLLSGCARDAESRQPGQSPSAPSAAGSAPPRSAASAAPAVPAGSSPSEPLKSVLTKYTAHPVVSFQSFSLGGNRTAAFALVDGGGVWYVASSGAQELRAGVASPEDDPSETTFLWTVGGVKLFKCENNPGGSSSLSCAWYVKDGRPVELPYTGMRLSYIGNGEFTTIGDAFDAGFTDGLASGHTYKIYYLYWAGDGLKEYGGIKITRQQLLKAKGAQAALNAIAGSGHTIDEIYYRSDNIININYHSGDRKNGNFDNVTLLYKNGAVTPKAANVNGPETEGLNEKNLSDFSYGGVYQAALFPKIATYPDRFM